MRYAAFILGLALIAAFLHAAEAEKPLGPEPPALKSVSTHEDLKKLDPIKVGETTIRLALETDHVPFGSGLLVYCLWDGKGGPLSGIVRNDQQKSLGPCIVEIKRIYDKGEPHDVQRSAGLEEKQSALRLYKGDALFIASVLPPAAGKYELSVLSQAGDLVAHTRIQCDSNEHKESAPHWHALIAVNAANESASYRLGNLMMPKWDDAVLTEIPKTLPTFLTSEDTPELKAAVNRGQITLTSAHDMQDQVAEALLIRIFINGQPEAQAMNFQEDISSATARKVVLTKELKFTLPTHPEDYGANPGDDVEVQFLYCPYGTESSAPNHVMRMQAVMVDDSAGVYLSNRVLLISGTKPAATSRASPVSP